MNRTSRPYAQWGIAFLLGVILTLLLSDRGDPLNAMAQSVQPRLGARGIFALTGQITKDSYGLFLIDVDAGTICVYRYFANRPEHERFQLVAVRSFLYDRYLEDYNTGSPSPKQVQELVRAAQSLRDQQAQEEKPLDESSTTEP